MNHCFSRRWEGAPRLQLPAQVNSVKSGKLVLLVTRSYYGAPLPSHSATRFLIIANGITFSDV